MKKSTGGTVELPVFSLFINPANIEVMQLNRFNPETLCNNQNLLNRVASRFAEVRGAGSQFDVWPISPRDDLHIPTTSVRDFIATGGVYAVQLSSGLPMEEDERIATLKEAVKLAAANANSERMQKELCEEKYQRIRKLYEKSLADLKIRKFVAPASASSDPHAIARLEKEIKTENNSELRTLIAELNLRMQEQERQFGRQLQEQERQFDRQLQEQGRQFDRKLQEQGRQLGQLRLQVRSLAIRELLRDLRRSIRSRFNIDRSIMWDQVVQSLSAEQLSLLDLTIEDLAYSRYESNQQQTTAIERANTVVHSYDMQQIAEQITSMQASRERSHLSRIFNFVYGRTPESLVFNNPTADE